MLRLSGNIPNHTPFLMGSGPGDAGATRGSEAALADVAATDSASAVVPRLAAQAAVTEDFRKSRRDVGIGTPPENSNKLMMRVKRSAVYSGQSWDPTLRWTSSFRPN